jgi:hypothetical protein
VAALLDIEIPFFAMDNSETGDGEMLNVVGDKWDAKLQRSSGDD